MHDARIAKGKTTKMMNVNSNVNVNKEPVAIHKNGCRTNLVINEKLRPSVEYWIALNIPNSAPTNPIPFTVYYWIAMWTPQQNRYTNLYFTHNCQKRTRYIRKKHLTIPCASSTTVKRKSVLLKLHEISSKF